MSIEDQIMSLNEGEFEVLYLKCKYQKNRVISDRIGLTERGVVDRMARVYTKFGLKKGEEHWTKRMEYMRKEVCPKLPKNFKEWQKRKEDYTYRDTVEETVEEFVDGSIVGEEPELVSGVVKSSNVDEAPPDPEMVYLVMYDDMRITEVAKEEPPLVIIGNEKPSLTGRVARFSLFGVLVCLAITVIAYYAFKLGSGLLTSAPPVQITVIVTTTPPLALTPPTASPILPTVGPTNTPIPTETFAPSATATIFIPPADGILFQDNFDNGLKADWKLDNAWIIADGALSRTSNNIDSYSWATLNEPAWKNYNLSVKINIPFMGSGGQSPVAIAVRVNGQAKYLGVEIPAFIGNALYFIGNNEHDSGAVAQRRVFDFESGSTLEIEANGNNFIVRINGRQVQQVSLSGYDSGGIALGMICGSGLGCPSFDDVKVTYLP